MSITTTADPAVPPGWFTAVERPPEPDAATLGALLDALSALAGDLGAPAAVHIYPDVHVIDVGLHDRTQLERWRLGVDQAREVASCADDQLRLLIQTADARHAGWTFTLSTTVDLAAPTTPENNR